MDLIIKDSKNLLLFITPNQVGGACSEKPDDMIMLYF